MLANVVHIKTIGHVVKNTKSPILAKYGVIHTLKCPNNPGEHDTNSNNYLKLTISLKIKYYSMPVEKDNKAKKKQMDTPI